MKRTYKLLKNKMISRALSVLTIGAAAVFLVGCTKCTTAAPQAHYTPTTSQARQADIRALRKGGVHVTKVGQTYRLVMANVNLFHPHSANIRQRYEYVLNRMTNLLNTYRIVTVKVSAYSAHKTKHIDALTKAQAKAVQSYLSDRGIKARLIYAVGEGNKHPIAWNGTHLGRKVNRRVEISFQYYTLGNNAD